MPSRLISSCIGLLLLGGCASYKPTAAPVEQVLDRDLVFNAEGYGAKVDPYLDQKRQQQYFNADFTKAGFLVVDVLVKNEGRDPVEVRPYDIYLVFPGGGQMAPMEGRVVATQIEENGSIVGSVLMFGLVGGIVATQAEHDAKNARILDYGGKELKETTLVPGASTQGYLFYRWTPSASAQAEFVLQLQDRTSNQLSELTVPYENSKVFAVPQKALFVASPPPATPPASPGGTQTASSGTQAQGASSTSGPYDAPVAVPFRIENGASTIEGVGKLDQGRFAGTAEQGAYSVNVAGEIKNGAFAFDLSGHFCPPSFGANASSSAAATISPAIGSVSASLQVTCAVTSATRAETASATIYFDFPKQNPTRTGLARAQAPSALAATSGPVEVPFKIDIGAEVVEGSGKLENGHLFGETRIGGRPITIRGDVEGSDLSLEIDGALNAPASALYGTYYCSAAAVTKAVAGKVAIRMNATCGPDNRPITVYLDLPTSFAHAAS